MEKSQCPFIIKIVNQEKRDIKSINKFVVFNFFFLQFSLSEEPSSPFYFHFLFLFSHPVPNQSERRDLVWWSLSEQLQDRLQGQLPLAYISNKPQNTEQAKSTAPNN